MKYLIIKSIIFSFAAILFCKISKNIATKLGILDYPDKIRKFHTTATPQIGGIIIYIIIIINFFFSTNPSFDLFYILWVSFFFLLGLLDDKYKIKWKIKFIFPTIFFLIYININEGFIINEIYSDIFNRSINIKGAYNFNIFFTLLCVLLLLNSINMIDGHNGICSTYSIYCFFYLLLINNNNLNEILLIILPTLFVITYFNLNNKIFLGNSGSFLLSAILSYYLIMNNNYYQKISVEKIFLLLIIPGLDMLRLFITRINNHKNPFSADRNHLHHLLFKNNKKCNQEYFFYFLILITPSILSTIEIVKNTYLIITVTILYFIIVKKIKKL
jgi:UDP-GlcNAc:undecaprenyl-phosphate GlcNAc-1-phosphate transferase